MYRGLTQPCTVVGCLCAFSARKRRRAALPPRRAPSRNPTAPATAGTRTRFVGRGYPVGSSSVGVVAVDVEAVVVCAASGSHTSAGRGADGDASSDSTARPRGWGTVEDEAGALSDRQNILCLVSCVEKRERVEVIRLFQLWDYEHEARF